MSDSLMLIWSRCQPVPVTPEPTDVIVRGYRCRKIGGVWCMYVPMSGDWYACQDWHAAECHRAARTPAGEVDRG